MKKLMVAIAAVASAFGLYAADLETGTSFEALETGAFDWTKDDAGQSNAPWWFTTEAEVDGTVTEYADGEAYKGDRPGKFDGENVKYLALETAKPLYRGATTLNTTSEVVTVDNAFGPQDIGTGFYVDQLVKFTAPSDSEATVDLADGGKIAIWLQEVELEEANATATNLMVTAGYFKSATETEQKNYIVNYDAASLVGTWHRVTIKAIKATNDGIAGFVVYIDGEPVTTADAIAAGEVAYTTLAQKYVGEKSLFPSADYESKNALTIAAVGFQGSGAIDDVSLTTVAPSFAADDNTIQLDWDPAAFTEIKAGDQVLNVADGSTNLTLAAGATTLTIEATAPGCTVSLASEDCGVSGMTFTDIVGSKAGLIVASFNFFEVNGQGYSTFADALAAAKAGDTITLKAGCTIDAETIPESGIVVDKEITLDLAGNDLLVDDEMPLFEVGAAFTVVNSGKKDAKIGIENVVEANVFAIITGGSVTIGIAENQDNFVVIQGAASNGDTPVIYQGKFDKELNTDTGAFAWLDGVPEEGYTVTSDDNYWIVKKEGGEPTTYEIKIITPENGTLETSVTNDVEVGTTVTVTATPAEGYELEMIMVDGTPLALDVTEFKMPAKDVEVSATFKKAEEPDPTEDDPEDIDDNETAADRYGDKIPTELADVSAKSICTWAKGNGKLEKGGAIIPEAFLLNCANTPDAVEAATKAFKIPSITVDAEGNVEIGEPEGEFNGTIKKFGKAELTDEEWSADLEGKKFFEIKLVPTNLN